MATKSSVARLIGEEWWLDKIMENGRRQYPKRIVVGHPINGRVYLPERTCHMTKIGVDRILAGWWECSECGPVYPPCKDEIAKWALQRCPRCGAKVVVE